MLKFKYLIENYGLAKTFINSYVHDSETLDDMLSKFRISSNAIYPFYSKQKLLFLRLSPAHEKKLNCIQAELEFLLYLKDNQFNALVPIKSQTGDYILTKQTLWGEYHAIAFESVNGYAIEDLVLTDSIVESYGKTLGKLHVLSSKFNPNKKRNTHIEIFDWIENIFVTNLVSEELKNQLKITREAMQNIQVNQDNYGLIHYDFEVDNVFYDEDKDMCYVIDFDDSMYHYYLIDIIQALESLKDIVEESNWDYTKSLFLKAYRSTGRDTGDLDRHYTIMHKFCQLFKYSRIINAMSEKLDDEPIWMIGLRTRLKDKITRLEKNITSS